MLRLLQLLPKAISARGGAVVETESAPPLALLEFQSPTAAIIATPIPFTARISGIWIGLLVFSGLLLCAVMPIDEVVTSTGQLVSSAPTVVVQPFDTSIVRSINVVPGQFVHKGDVLATLDPTVAQADLSALTQQEQGYAAQVAQLTAQEEGKPYIPDPTNPESGLQLQTYNQQVGQYNATVDDYTQKIASLQTQINGFNSQAAYYRQRVDYAHSIQSMRTQLQNLQVGSKLDTLAAQDELVSMQASLASALSSAQQAEKDLASQQAERDSFIQQWKATTSTQLSQAILNETQTEDSLVKAKVTNKLQVLIAPQDSIVLAIGPISVGAVVQSGATLMQTVPANAPLSVEALLDGSMDSGYVHPGDHVVIKFSTLPFLQFGSAQGIVKSVSASTFNPLDQSQTNPAGPPLPGAPQDLYYKAEVSLDVLNLHNLPDGFVMTPGMPVEADVQVGTRTIMEFFTRRIMPAVFTAFHEP